MSHEVHGALLKVFAPDDVIAAGVSHGCDWVRVRRELWAPVGRFLRTDETMRFARFVDLAVVDNLGRRHGEAAGACRFDLVLHLGSMDDGRRVRVVAGVPEDDPTIGTLVPLWPGAGWFEREAFDMFGVRFQGHPDQRRLFLPSTFIGHPLRKDYPKERRQPVFRRSWVEGVAFGGTSGRRQS